MTSNKFPALMGIISQGVGTKMFCGQQPSRVMQLLLVSTCQQLFHDGPALTEPLRQTGVCVSGHG
jgi:hypothetical protein